MMSRHSHSHIHNYLNPIMRSLSSNRLIPRITIQWRFIAISLWLASNHRQSRDWHGNLKSVEVVFFVVNVEAIDN